MNDVSKHEANRELHQMPKDSPPDGSTSPSAWDYFKAGAKDFAEDVKSSISGTSRGPSMKYRKELSK